MKRRIIKNEVFDFRFNKTLPDVSIAFFAAFVPFYADLLELYEPSG